MIRKGTACALAACVAACLLGPGRSAQAGPFSETVFARGADVNASGPDSITFDGTHVFVQYSNGASSTLPPGQDGSSTIAEYDLSGKVLNTYSVPGSADGVRYNSATNQLWVLQNQDSNSLFTTIDVGTGAMSHYVYTPPTVGRGFDDVTFAGGNAYMSYTNPPGASNPSAPILYQATLGAGVVNLIPILAFNATGTNSATGQTGTIVANDPDSLTQRTDGSLLLTSEADGALTTVTHPGTGAQSVSFVSLIDSTGKNVTGLDDTVFPTSSDQRLLVSDSANNIVYALTGPFQPGSYYASLSSTNSVDSVNLTTGVSTSISDGLFGANASPHGLGFIPAAVPEPSTLLMSTLSALMGLSYYRFRRQRSR